MTAQTPRPAPLDEARLTGLPKAAQDYFMGRDLAWGAAFNRAERRGNDAMRYCDEHNAAAQALDNGR